MSPAASAPMPRRAHQDEALGAYPFNLVAVELLFAAMLGTTVIATWPDPPWALIQWGGAALMIVGAVACYPLATALWLAFDVTLRPVERDELATPGARTGRPASRPS